MVGMEEGLFPHARTLMNPEEIEEERRTCYVGITRAQRKLYLTNARQRTIYGRTNSYPPSRFLEEIPDEYVERLVPRANAYASPMPIIMAPSSVRLYEFPPECEPDGPRHAFCREAAVSARGARSPAETPAACAAGRRRHPPGYEHQVKVGDKARHGKWGIGTVVSVKGSGEEVELKIAFPGQGVKGLMQKYAPIEKA